MTEEPLCRYCKQAAGAHSVAIVQGVATAYVLDHNGHPKYCSEFEADQREIRATIQELDTMVRSLRYRATRIENRKVYVPDYLRDWADKLVVRANKLEQYLQEVYS